MLVLLMLLGCVKNPTPEEITGPTPTETVTTSTEAPVPTLMISGYTSEKVHMVNATTGRRAGVLDDVAGAQSIHRGPDGDLYVVAEVAGQILRFDGDDLSPLGAFVFDDPDTATDELDGVREPTAAIFGPDGGLYVAGFTSSNVVRFDATTGQSTGTFVEAGLGGLAGPDAGMLFLPDGTLLVPGFESNSLITYDGVTGERIAVIADASDGLNAPRCIWVLPDRILVTNWRASEVLSMNFDGSDIQVFATVSGPTGITQHPETGEILVLDSHNDVRRLDPETGDDLGRLVDGEQIGIDGGNFLTWR